VPEPFEHSSRRLRATLAPIVERVVARHRDTPVELREPATPRGVWFTVPDDAGQPLALVSAHASAVNFLLGKRGFPLFRDTASHSAESLERWFEDVLDGVLGGGLDVDGDRATLTTRGGTITLAG
jgi:hypothetical protein